MNKINVPYLQKKLKKEPFKIYSGTIRWMSSDKINNSCDASIENGGLGNFQFVGNVCKIDRHSELGNWIPILLNPNIRERSGPGKAVPYNQIPLFPIREFPLHIFQKFCLQYKFILFILFSHIYIKFYSYLYRSSK